MSSYSGYILSNPSAASLNAKELEITQAAFPRGPTLIYKGSCYGIKRWDQYTLLSTAPLVDEPPAASEIFEYQIFLIRGRDKLVVLAARKRIVDYFLSQILDRRVFPNCRKVGVLIDRIIDFSAQPESEFLITSLHGRFAGSTREIRSMSLYGDDVTNSGLYVDYRKFFNFHSAGLGRRLFNGLPRLRPNEEGEIVRVSHDGFLTLNITNRAKAQELLKVVTFLYENDWLEDWVSANWDLAGENFGESS